MSARRPWVCRDDEILCAQFPDMPTATIAVTLGRTVSATHQRAQKLGLRKRDGFVADTARARMTPDHPARAAQFVKGHPTWNAGKAHPATGRAAETQFKHGRVPHTWVPVGSTRLDKDGLLVLKVADLPGKAGWISAHRNAWELANGPLPAGLLVVFKPGRRTTDPELITSDAVEAIDRAELMRRNTYHRYGPEIARIYQLRGAINRQINQRMKDGDHA